MSQNPKLPRFLAVFQVLTSLQIAKELVQEPQTTQPAVVNARHDNASPVKSKSGR